MNLMRISHQAGAAEIYIRVHHSPPGCGRPARQQPSREIGCCRHDYAQYSRAVEVVYQQTYYGEQLPGIVSLSEG
jgi:hypothetical protein